MTITYPRDFPNYCLSVRGSTDLAYQQSFAMTGGAQPNVADLGPPYWTTNYKFEVSGRAMIASLGAWTDSLDGGLRAFKGIPIRGGRLYRWPLSRPTGFTGLIYSGSQWDGDGNMFAIGGGRDTISVGQLPNGLVISPGDYVSLTIGSRQHLHRIVEGGTVASSQVVLGVRPYVRPNAILNTPVLFERPWCDMVIMGKVDKPQDERLTGVVSFSAVQALI